MPGKELQNISNNTYGLEVEFCSHRSHMLSFTHIEVCFLYPAGFSPADTAWKIETDAGYTFELVSPVMMFDSADIVEAFRKELLLFLQTEVVKNNTLLVFMESLSVFIRSKFKRIDKGVWIYGIPDVPLPLEISWITCNDLIHALSWFNWDDTTEDLQLVLKEKGILEDEFLHQNDVADQLTKDRMQQVILLPSEKHDSLPSSQLNLPMRLWVFAYYETAGKRSKAWERLMEEQLSGDNLEKYIQRKIDAIQLVYKDLAKDISGEYITEQLRYKTSVWHNYWLWLETFYICAGFLSTVRDWGDTKKIAAYADQVKKIISEDPGSCEGAKRILKALDDNTYLKFHVSYVSNLSADLFYLLVHKLVTGALSELSESTQMVVQEEVMQGLKSEGKIIENIPGKEFLPFHYSLKDLTSLWFKAPLLDVFDTEKKVEGQTKEVDAVIDLIRKSDPVNLAGILVTVLNSNMDLLKWLYHIHEKYGQPFPLSWEEFKQRNMPDIDVFEKSLIEVIRPLQEWNMILLGTCDQFSPEDATFLQRSYPKGRIAPWEGRWDTMKKPIRTYKSLPTYLVEHRNH